MTTREKFQMICKVYLDNLKADRVSINTLSNYEQRLNMFSAFLSAETSNPPSTIDAMNWKKALSDRGIAPSTIKQYMVEVKAFFNWSVDMGYYKSNPFTSRIMPKSKKPHPYENLLTPEQIVRLLSSERPSGMSRETWPKIHAMIVLFLTSGIRNSELRALKWYDLDWENGKITIEHGKGDKYRTVPFPAIAQSAMRDFLNSTKTPLKTDKKTCEYIFVEKEKTVPMTRQGVSQAVERTVKIILGVDGVRSHALRHANASFMLSNGMSMEDIKELLGHSDIRTTQRYAEQLMPSAPTARGNKLFEKISQFSA